MSTEPKCPHCGAEVSFSGSKKRMFACLVWQFTNGKIRKRTPDCYEREIAALRAMLAAQCEARTNSLGETCWFYPNDDRQYKSSAEAIQAELEIWMQKPLPEKEV